jgi:hypothetical protein
MGFALPSSVINTNSAYFFAGPTNTLGPLVKDIGEQTLIVLDYSKVTPATTITGYTFAVDVSSNPDLVVAYPTLNSTSDLLTFLVSGGIEGQQYNITITAQLSPSGTRNDVLTVNVPSSNACECALINPVPSLYSQLPVGTQAYVNTGTRYFWGNAAPANPNVMDQWYNPSTATLSEWVTDGTSFFWETMAAAGYVTDAPSNSINYIRYNGHWVADPLQTDAPSSGQTFGRRNGAWVVEALQSDAPSNGQLYARQNGGWALAPSAAIGTDAPSNGQLYGRQNGAWTLVPGSTITTDAPNDGNVYLRKYNAWSSGGVLTGALAVQGNLAANGSLSVGGSATITGVTTFGAQVALPYDPISPLQAATKQYVDNNYLSITGAMSSYLPLAGGTLTGALNLSGAPGAPLQATTKLYVDGRTPITLDAPADGQAWCRSNNGWIVSPSGGMTDAPNNAYVYMRGQAAWQTGGTLNGNLTINGVTTLSADPAAAMQPVTLQYFQARTPTPTSLIPLMDGTAVAGTSVLYARGDHVHPSDTSRYAASNPAGYINTAQAVAAAPVQSVAGRTGAVTLTHTDITDWSASLAPYALLNSPALIGTPTAPTAAPGTNTAQLATTQFVSASFAPINNPTFTGTVTIPAGAVVAGYLALSGGTLTGPLILSADPTTALGAATKQYVDTPANMTIDCGVY